MATSNFQTWDAPQVNMDTDAQYISDPMRSNGAPTGAILPSTTFNKFALQTSIFSAAFGQMMAAKGFNMSDTDQGALTSSLANLLTANDLKPNLVNVAFSPTPTFDGNLGNGFQINLAGNVNSSSAIDLTPGQVYTWSIRNPSGFSFAWPSNIFGGRVPTAGTPNSTNVQQFLALSDGNAYAVTDMLDQVVAGLQSGKQDALGFTPVQQGGGLFQGASKVHIGWDGANLRAQVDSTDLGGIVFQTMLNSLITSSPSANGWIEIGGIIFQWATGFAQATGNNVQQVINFPRSFPNNCWAVMTSSSSSNASDGKPQLYTVIGKGLTSVTLQQLRGDNQGSITTTPTIFAVGN